MNYFKKNIIFFTYSWIFRYLIKKNYNDVFNNIFYVMVLKYIFLPQIDFSLFYIDTLEIEKSYAGSLELDTQR